MPTSFLSADAGFPRLTNDIPMEERMNRIQQYLYMLLEQLRYALANLSEDNFNEADLAKLQEETVSGIRSVVTDLEGNVSILEQTATSLTSQISDIEGNVSTLQQTAEGLTSRVSDAEGNISTLQQTAEGLVTTVSSLDGDISVVSQKADRIDWIVASGTSASTMTLTSEMASLIADEISITGVVTLNDLATEGRSVINGNNVLLQGLAGSGGSNLVFINQNDNAFGYAWARDTSVDLVTFKDDYALTLEANPTIDSGRYTCGLLLKGGSTLRAEAETVSIRGDERVVVSCAQNTNPIMIQGTAGYNSSLVTIGFYSFCNDGIYYGNNRIVSV